MAILRANRSSLDRRRRNNHQRCTGLLLRLPSASRREIVHQLVRRQITVREDLGMARWIRVATVNGPVQALVFWARPSGKGISLGLPLESVAWRLAHACGHYGSSADYLYQTVAKLEEHGIRDSNLWRLQKLVAAEIEKWDRSPAPELVSGKLSANLPS